MEGGNDEKPKSRENECRREFELGFARAGGLNNWCKMVIILIFGFGGSFEARSSFLLLCSSRPSRTCRGASDE